MLKSSGGGSKRRGLDLTKSARAGVASVEREPVKMRGDDAAGALAFAATDRELEGEQTYGSPLAGLLLRLKYADQFSKPLFTRAHLILLDRHGGPTTQKNGTKGTYRLRARFK